MCGIWGLAGDGEAFSFLKAYSLDIASPAGAGHLATPNPTAPSNSHDTALFGAANRNLKALSFVSFNVRQYGGVVAS